MHFSRQQFNQYCLVKKVGESTKVVNGFTIMLCLNKTLQLFIVSKYSIHENTMFLQEYLLGDQDQKMLPVAFSLMASFMSAITLLGVSAEIYMYGTLFFVINLSYVIFTPVSAYLFLPVFFKLQATSAYEVRGYELIGLASFSGLLINFCNMHSLDKLISFFTKQITDTLIQQNLKTQMRIS